MLSVLITLLIILLALYVVYWGASQFVQGTPLKIIGAILALIFLLYALNSVMPGLGGHALIR